MARTSAPRLRVKDSAFLRKARERFKWADESDSKQAQRERDDIAFEAGEQWPADIKLSRQGQQAVNGMPAVPARPTIVINQIKPRVRKILNQERASDIGIELVPADDFGDLGITPDDTEVTLREGLIRRIQRESQAADARSWAFKRALIAGRGYYLVMTRYLPGKTNDQELYVHRIYNQSAVLLDPSHEMPDGSDADFGFIATWMPWDRYKDEFGKLADGKDNPFMDATDSEFVTMTEQYPDWYRAENDQKAIRVVDYWYVKREARELVTLNHMVQVPSDDDEEQALGEPTDLIWRDQLPEKLPAGLKVIDTRRVVERQVKFCKIGGGVQELEKTDWLTPDMPIIKVIGDEVLPYDSERRFEGMVRPSIGSQQGLNGMVSKQVEVVAYSPLQALIVDPEAIEGYEEFYKVANTRALPYLPARTRDDEGREFKEPHRPQVDPNIMAIAQSIALFNQAIQDTTDVQDPAMGKTDPSVKSARHAEKLIAESSEGTSNWMDNLKRSLEYEAKVLNNLLYPIYGSRPGRLVRILTGEGESQMMRVGEGQQPNPQAQQQQKAEQVGKLTKDAHFNVIVKVTRSTDSRREQFVRMFGDILNADPQQMAVGGDLFYKNMDIPEAKQLSKRQRMMLAPPIQAMLEQDEQGQEQIPPAVQQKLAKMQEQIQAAEAALAEAMEQAKGKTLESETKLKIAQLEAERDERVAAIEAERDKAVEQAKLALEEVKIDADLEKAKMDNATKIHVAEIAAKTKGVIQAAEAEHEAIALAHTTQHESEQAALDRENLERQADRQEAEAERSRQFEASQKDEATT